MEQYDLIIIGAGPAGMNSAVYAGRYLLKTLVIGELLGGLVSEADEILNFLSHKKIEGLELTKKMTDQVKELGVNVKNEKVLEVSGKDGSFNVKTNSGNYSSKKLILATGWKKRKLGLKREKELMGKGVSYCATCEAVFFKDKVVGVVGGGNSAITAALLISEYAQKVFIIYRQKEFARVTPAWMKSVRKNKKIELILEANVTELIGKDKLESVKLDTGKELALDGLFIEIGSIPSSELADKLKVKLDNGFVLVDKFRKTNVSGVFSAGDVTNGPMKQIITAAADGAIAATTAYEELKEES